MEFRLSDFTISKWSKFKNSTNKELFLFTLLSTYLIHKCKYTDRTIKCEKKMYMLLTVRINATILNYLCFRYILLY